MKVSLIIILSHGHGYVALRRRHALDYFFVLERGSVHFLPYVTG